MSLSKVCGEIPTKSLRRGFADYTVVEFLSGLIFLFSLLFRGIVIALFPAPSAPPFFLN